MPTDTSLRELAARYLLLAEEVPNDPALIYERSPYIGRRLTWSDIATRSDDLINQYRSNGLRSGARCAVTLADHIDVIPALLALWRMDSTAVLVDPAWGSRLRDNVINHSGANFALDMASDAHILQIRNSYVFDHSLPDGTAMLGYTSGSTGDPKGIPFTHSKLALTQHYSSAACAALHTRPPSSIGCSTRLSGSGVLNLNYTWAPFIHAPVVILPELTLTTAREYWNRIEQHGVEQTYIFPAQVELLNQVALSRSPESPRPLCLTGSAPVSERLHTRFIERFELPLFNCFGISEAMCQNFFGNSDRDGNSTTEIGVPYFLQARIVDEDGVVEGEGEGELQLSGPTLFDYYYANPTATAEAFDGRWFRTGDIVQRNAAGVYKISGRRKHVVMKGGHSIYLNEVEDSALSISEVVEAAAVSLIIGEHEDIGLIVRLQPESTTTTTEIHHAISSSLGAQRSPCRVISIASPLPRTGNQKLDRPVIQQLWQVETSRST